MKIVRRPRRSAALGRGRPASLLAALACATAAMLLSATNGLAGTGGMDATEARPTAHAARTLNATDTAHLLYREGSGSLLDEEGAASGTLPGRMQARCNLGATFTADFTIYTHGGTIKGHGTATPSGSGRYESFSGLLKVSGGTGRYTHAHGTAKLYGTFDRKSLDIVVQTVGKLSY